MLAAYICSVAAFWGVIAAAAPKWGGIQMKNLHWTILTSLVPGVNIIIAAMIFIYF